MMNLLKTDIIEKYEELKQENKNLADAIKEKDNVIANEMERRNEVENELFNLKSVGNDQAKKERTLEIKNEKLLERIKELEEIERRRVDELNKLIFAYGSFLKTVQGAVETSSLLQENLIKKITSE